MATKIFTPSMLRGAGTRGVPEIPVGSSFTNTYSMEFDGVDEYFNTEFVAPSGDFTLSYWLKSDGATFGGENNQAYPVSIAVGGVNYGTGKISYANSSGRAQWGVGTQAYAQDGTGVGKYSTWRGQTELDDSVWHHIMQVYKTGGTNTTFWYVDGAVETLDHWSDGSECTITNQVVNLTKRLGIGADFDTYAYRYGELKGWVDEVAIFGADESSNISTIYNGGTPGDLTSLSPLGWWRMGDAASWDAGTGIWTLTDQGSEGDDGTSNNMEEADRDTDVPPT